MTKSAKSFEELVAANPDLFDDFDCMPGPSNLDASYSDALVPEHMRERVLALRQKRRAAQKVDGAE